LILLFLPLISCGSKPANKEIILAITTNVQDIGLPDVLTNMFKESTGYKIKAIAVGLGEAMTMDKCDAVDMILIHSPMDEETFMSEGSAKAGCHLILCSNVALAGILCLRCQDLFIFIDTIAGRNRKSA
jgi:tungstate transport system substrate-binding protein